MGRARSNAGCSGRIRPCLLAQSGGLAKGVAGPQSRTCPRRHPSRAGRKSSAAAAARRAAAGLEHRAKGRNRPQRRDGLHGGAALSRPTGGRGARAGGRSGRAGLLDRLGRVARVRWHRHRRAGGLAMVAPPGGTPRRCEPPRADRAGPFDAGLAGRGAARVAGRALGRPRDQLRSGCGRDRGIGGRTGRGHRPGRLRDI